MSESNGQPMRVLFVCTANICRSPMAAALMSAELARHHVPALVLSAGLQEGGRDVAEGSVHAVARRGLDLSEHRSHRVNPNLLAGADLILTMEHWHVQEVVLLERDVWPRTFTLLEFVRRASAVGPRREGEPLERWTARVHAGRRPQDLAGAWKDDIEDPYGRSDNTFRRTADELDRLIRQVVALLVPGVAADVSEVWSDAP